MHLSRLLVPHHHVLWGSLIQQLVGEGPDKDCRRDLCSLFALRLFNALFWGVFCGTSRHLEKQHLSPNKFGLFHFRQY